MILDECGHDERRRLIEVYDDSQPAVWIEIAAIEALAPRRGVLLMMVRKAYGVQDRGCVLDHLWPAALQMADRALVEDELPETSVITETL
jgi:xanthine/CO dehydrogenase XdhC/CoxF family maturation factor